MEKDSKKALLIVDVQKDFCPGGALAVPGGDTIVSNLNNYIELFSKKRLPIFVSRDWHPSQSKHFKDFGGKWPVHCIQNTDGAEFHSELKLPEEAMIISKGMEPEKEGYSAFDGYGDNNRPFIELLKELAVEELYIGGLATDYCVKWSVVGALERGFKAWLLIDAIKGVDVTPGDSERAIKEMLDAGAEKVTLSELRLD